LIPDASARRWHVYLSILAWTFIVQSGFGVLTGFLAFLPVDQVLSGIVPAELAPYLSQTGYGAAGALVSKAVLVGRIATAVDAMLLAGSIGLLLRKKWGWYSVVLLNIAEVIAVFALGMPLMYRLLVQFSIGRAGVYSFVIALLLACIPGMVVAFLMAGPVTRQFEKEQPEAGSGDHRP